MFPNPLRCRANNFHGIDNVKCMLLYCFDRYVHVVGHLGFTVFIFRELSIA